MQTGLLSYVANLNTPYFIRTTSSNSDIGLLELKLTDANGHPLPSGDENIEMTINHSVFM